MNLSGSKTWNPGPSGMNTQPQVAIPKSPMQTHAETVHELASRLQELNGRLCEAIDRIGGAAPQESATKETQPAPNGALVIAQFGAERINLSLDRLSDLVGRLESIV